MSQSQHTIEPRNSALPSLTIHSAAFAPWDERYDFDVDRFPSAVEPVEHELRLDARQAGAMRSIPQSKELLDSYNPYQVDPEDDPDPWSQKMVAKPLVVKYMEQTCQNRIEEEQRFYANVDYDQVIQEAPEYLERELRQAREADDRQSELEEIRSNRVFWYEKLIPYKNLYAMFTENSLGSLLRTGGAYRNSGKNQFYGAVVVDEGTDPTEYAHDQGLNARFVYSVDDAISNYDRETCHPSDYGIELPAPLVVGDFLSGSTYLFLPWSDGLVCSCPFKQRKSWRVMCKHELFTSLWLGENGKQEIKLDEGFSVPARARRFFSPDALANRERKQLR